MAWRFAATACRTRNSLYLILSGEPPVCFFARLPCRVFFLGGHWAWEPGFFCMGEAARGCCILRQPHGKPWGNGGCEEYEGEWWMVTRDRGNRNFVIERPYSLKKKKEGQNLWPSIGNRPSARTCHQRKYPSCAKLTIFSELTKEIKKKRGNGEKVVWVCRVYSLMCPKWNCSWFTQGVATLYPGLWAFALCLSFQPATFGSARQT